MERLRVAVVLLAVTGCYPRAATPPGELSAPEIEAVKSRWPDANADALEHGRHIFLDHCDHCHGYPDLSYLKAAEWPATAERMGKKSELDAAELEALQRWIAAAYPKAAAPKGL